MNLHLARPTFHHFLPYLCVLLWAVACFAFFQTAYAYHFFYQEQNQLFLLSWTNAADYLHRPAWLASLVGDFLTQFYYYRYAGPVILTGALLILGDLVRRSLQHIGLRQGAFVVAIAVMTLFALFSLRHDYRLASIIAADGGCVAAWVCMRLLSCLPSTRLGKVLAACALFVASLLVFWMLGNGGFLFVLLLIIYSVTAYRRGQSVWLLVVATLLPLSLIPLTKRVYMMNLSDILASPGIGKLSRPEWALEKDWTVYAEYSFGNWQRVVNIVEREPHPTQGQLFFYNLVMAQHGQLPFVILRYPDNYLGTLEPVGSKTPIETIKRMNELYWALGDMTFCERAAMLGMVFSPDNRNARMVKRLAEANLVSGDDKAAEKYLRLLGKTWVYQSWARGAAKDASYHRKAQYTNRQDTLRLTDNAHTIMSELLESNPKNTVALDYLLCSDLMLGDVNTFKRDYDRFSLPQGGRVVPLYQQALMIWLAAKQAPHDVWQQYIKMPDQLLRFEQYNQQRGSIAFKDTYWFWYDMAQKNSQL